MSDNNIKKCYGVIAMIDALGVRNYSNDECMHFLKTRKELVNKSIPRWNIASSHDSKTENDSKKEIHFLSFADTLIIAVEMLEFSSIHGSMKFPSGSIESDYVFYGLWLERLSWVLGDLIRDGIMNKIIFRGALSAGEYLLDKESNSILGPTINDVANWYESFESGGIILTPHASSIIDYLSNKGNRSPKECIEKTNIVLKGKQTKSLYVVNWPNAFCYGSNSKTNINKAKNDFLISLSQIYIPFGNEDKYSTIYSFFNEVIKKKNISKPKMLNKIFNKKKQ